MVDASLKPVVLRVEIPKNLKDTITTIQKIAQITDRIFKTQKEKRYGRFGENDPRHSLAENVMTVGEKEPKETSYHEYFEQEFKEIAALLESTQIKKFQKIAAALKDKKDIDFVKIKKILPEDSGQIHLTFGPFEQYSDPRHVRTDFQCDALFQSTRYNDITRLFEHENYSVWIPEKFQVSQQKRPNFFIGDMVLSGGFHDDTLPMAQVLPNEPSLAQEYGTMITVAANIIEAKTENNIVPIGETALQSKIALENAKKVQVLVTLAHEIMHTVGRKAEKYSSLREHVTFDEGRAISGSLISALAIIKEKGEFRGALRTALEMDLSNYLRYLLRGVDNFSYGAYSCYAISQLMKSKAITINQSHITIENTEKYVETVKRLQTEMLEVVSDQNKKVYDAVLAEITAFWQSKKIEGVLEKIRQKKIFRDIKPTFELVYV